MALAGALCLATPLFIVMSIALRTPGQSRSLLAAVNEVPLSSAGFGASSHRRAIHPIASHAAPASPAALWPDVFGYMPPLDVDALALDARPADRAAQATPNNHSATEAGGAATNAGQRMFNGRPVRPVKTMQMLVTAYSPDERSCGDFADNVTASGYSVWTNGMKLAAADTKLLPFGSLISVPGYDGGNIVPVLDRGGAIKGRRLDMLYPTHEQARRWGAQDLEVTVWEYADGLPNDFIARYNSASAVKN